MVPAPLSMLATRDEPRVNLRARERVPSLTDRRVFVRSYLEEKAAFSETLPPAAARGAPRCDYYRLLRCIFKSLFTID